MSDMSNTGDWPLDPSTAIGLFRIEIGDTVGTPGSPATTAEFEFFSDDALQALLDAYPDSRDTAVGKAMIAVANRLIYDAQDIQVDTIRIRTVERANLMLQIASGMLSRAGAAAAASSFQIVPLVSSTRVAWSSGPQGTPSPWPGGF